MVGFCLPLCYLFDTKLERSVLVLVAMAFSPNILSLLGGVVALHTIWSYQRLTIPVLCSVLSMECLYLVTDPRWVCIWFSLVGLFSYVLITTSNIPTASSRSICANVVSEGFMLLGLVSSTAWWVVPVLIKSAQWPFSSWLTYAVRTPSVVSAFLHSGGIVVSGLLLTGKADCAPVEAFILLSLLMTCARLLQQTDLKVILGYSTIIHISLLLLNHGSMDTHGILKSAAFLCFLGTANYHSKLGLGLLWICMCLLESVSFTWATLIASTLLVAKALPFTSWSHTLQWVSLPAVFVAGLLQDFGSLHLMVLGAGFLLWFLPKQFVMDAGSFSPFRFYWLSFSYQASFRWPTEFKPDLRRSGIGFIVLLALIIVL